MHFDLAASPYNIRCHKNDDITEYDVLDLMSVNGMAKVLGDVVGPVAPVHIFCSAQ